MKWDGRTPHTRQKGEDNRDLILFNRNTRNLEVFQSGLFTRGGEFYVFAQKTWEGWIEGADQNLEFIPTSPYAYPGNEFGKAFPILAQIIKEQIPNLSRGGLVEEPVGIKEGTWEPNFPPAKVGWQRGSVLFFNVLTGVGRIMDNASGEVYIIHFSTRVVEGNLSMGIPCPEQGVYYRPRLKKEDRVINQVKAWIIA